MNRQEWLLGKCKRNSYYKQVQKLLKKWKRQNDITERCVVHHRDDTEETQKYNEEHYELWGLNLDGTFEHGKYVVFMTSADHCSYHHKNRALTDEHRAKIGASNKGKVRSEEARQKNRDAHVGLRRSETTKSKMSAAHKNRKQTDVHRKNAHDARLGTSFLYTVYKENNGILKWNDFCHALSKGEITFEIQHISVFVK